MVPLATGAAESCAVHDASFVPNKKLAIHRWVDWIAGFSSEFVREALARFAGDPGKGAILDPFAGVGTTLVEAHLAGYPVIGFEINPFACLACRVKLGACSMDASRLRGWLEVAEMRLFPIERCVDQLFEADRLEDAPAAASAPPPGFRTRIPFFSRAVEIKVLHFLDFLNSISDPMVRDLFALAFGSVMVSFSNYTYEPSLASRPGSGKPVIENAPVMPVLLGKLRTMAEDIEEVRRTYADAPEVRKSWCVLDRSFLAGPAVAPGSVQLVVTSPPYLNNYHYVRNTRPQMYWLGLVGVPADLKRLEEDNYGKFWQTVREGPPVTLVFRHEGLERLLEELRSLNVSRGAYGGPGWANYAACYFNDTFRFMKRLKEYLRKGGYAVVVIGNSILQGLDVPVDRYFVEIGELVGLEPHAVELLREKRVGSSIVGTGARKQTRGSTNGLYESAVILRRP